MLLGEDSAPASTPCELNPPLPAQCQCSHPHHPQPSPSFPAVPIILPIIPSHPQLSPLSPGGHFAREGYRAELHRDPKSHIWSTMPC